MMIEKYPRYVGMPARAALSMDHLDEVLGWLVQQEDDDLDACYLVLKTVVTILMATAENAREEGEERTWEDYWCALLESRR